MDSLLKSNETESAILCSIFLSGSRGIEMCEASIKPEYFAHPCHKLIYEAILGLRNAGTPTDWITLTGELQKARRLEEIGGAAYLAELQTIIPTSANLPYYLEILTEMYHKRQISKAARSLEEATEEGKDGLLEASKEVLASIANWKDNVIQGHDDPTDQKAWFEVIEIIENRFDRTQKGQLEGVPTGIRWVNQLTQGLQRETFYYIGGLPSEGKSGLLSQIAVCSSRIPRVSDGRGHKSLILSMEMSGIKFRERMLCQDRAVTSGALKSGLFSEADLARFTGTIGHLRDHVFVYARRLTVSQIAQVIKRALAKHSDLDWIGIDYLQYVIPENTKKNGNREREIAEISQGLNDLKNQFGLPIVCCAALNADQEKGKGRKPILSDFRESKQAAYDADTVLFLDAEPNGPSRFRDVEFLILKNRDGGLDERQFQFDKSYLLFQEKDY